MPGKNRHIVAALLPCGWESRREGGNHRCAPSSPSGPGTLGLLQPGQSHQKPALFLPPCWQEQGCQPEPRSSSQHLQGALLLHPCRTSQMKPAPIQSLLWSIGVAPLYLYRADTCFSAPSCCLLLCPPPSKALGPPSGTASQPVWDLAQLLSAHQTWAG